MSFASWQCALQYLPNLPPSVTTHEQLSCSHFADFAISVLPVSWVRSEQELFRRGSTGFGVTGIE